MPKDSAPQDRGLGNQKPSAIPIVPISKPVFIQTKIPQAHQPAKTNAIGPTSNLANQGGKTESQIQLSYQRPFAIGLTAKDNQNRGLGK
jgi:hypothetical protein